MNDAELDKRIDALVSQMKERINLAIGVAADETHSFEEGEAILREVLDALKRYECHDVAADQLVNFSKVAYFRGNCRKTLALAREAAETARSAQTKRETESSLRQTAYRLLELSIDAAPDAPEARLVTELEQVLTPEDYCKALRKSAAAVTKTEEGESRSEITGFVHRLSLELLRQGLRQEKLGNTDAAKLLLRQTLPFLNPKRAELVSKELEKLENLSHE